MREKTEAAALAALRTLIHDPQVHIAFHWKKSDRQHRRDLKADAASYTGVSQEEARRRISIMLKKAPSEVGKHLNGISQDARKQYAHLVLELLDFLPEGVLDLLAEEAWDKELDRRASNKCKKFRDKDVLDSSSDANNTANTEHVVSFLACTSDLARLFSASGSGAGSDFEAKKKRYKKIVRELSGVCGDHLRDRDFVGATNSPLWATMSSTPVEVINETRDVFVCVYCPGGDVLEVYCVPVLTDRELAAFFKKMDKCDYGLCDFLDTEAEKLASKIVCLACVQKAVFDWKSRRGYFPGISCMLCHEEAGFFSEETSAEVVPGTALASAKNLRRGK